MNYCRYSIIPTQQGTMSCSSCGKEIDDLPYYTQAAEFSTCIKNDDEANYYVCIGLGTPMCEDCHDKIANKLERIDDIHSYFVLVSSAIALGIAIYLWRAGDDVPWGWFGMAIVFGLSILVIKSQNIIQKFINKKMKDYGKPELRRPYEYFEKNGWIQVMNESDQHKNYTLASLGQDLDNICGDGKFCILNNETGYIVDYKDPVTLKKIYSGSIYFCRKYELVD